MTPEVPLENKTDEVKNWNKLNHCWYLRGTAGPVQRSRLACVCGAARLPFQLQPKPDRTAFTPAAFRPVSGSPTCSSECFSFLESECQNTISLLFIVFTVANMRRSRPAVWYKFAADSLNFYFFIYKIIITTLS